MQNPKPKVIQTKISKNTYEIFREISKKKGLTIKKAIKEAVYEWIAYNGDLKKDPIFNIKKSFDIGKKTDSSKVDEVVYSKEGIE